jgi:hypothetical protein
MSGPHRHEVLSTEEFTDFHLKFDGPACGIAVASME